MTSSKFDYSTIPLDSGIICVITFVKCGKMAVRVTWNAPKTRHEIITGAPNDDRAYNNALKELKRYSIISKATQNAKRTSQRGSGCSRTCTNGTDPTLPFTGQCN